MYVHYILYKEISFKISIMMTGLTTLCKYKTTLSVDLHVQNPKTIQDNTKYINFDQLTLD
jgi:hypothetical protein